MAKKFGADRTLPKPFEKEELLNAVITLEKTLWITLQLQKSLIFSEMPQSLQITTEVLL